MDQNSTAAGGRDSHETKRKRKRGLYLYSTYKCTVFIVDICLSLLLECNKEKKVSASNIVHSLVKEK